MTEEESLLLEEQEIQAELEAIADLYEWWRSQQ